MIPVDGYRLTEKLREARTFMLYRGVAASVADDGTFLFKVLKKEYLSPVDVARLNMEYEKIQRIDSDHLVKIYRAADSDAGFVLVMEDFDGIPLSLYRNGRPLDVETFLLIAIQTAEAINDMHSQDILHGDIRPQNILINEKTGSVKVGNFGVSSLLTKEIGALSDGDALSDTLPYISPEQTGRMNRFVDYRTDFYSLGTVFYKLLTGDAPFRSSDALSLMHSHIAKEPKRPSAVQETIPAIVSNIAMKLLAKNAEDRYQSGYGLEMDLEKCLEQLRTRGTIEAFSLGARDLSGKFRIPQKIYGRAKEIEILLKAFERVGNGATEMMLISGLPGAGKTALINEGQMHLTGGGFFYIAGKFDQLKKDMPYSAVIQALQGLVRKLLTESDEGIRTWKEKILAAVGVNGGVITEVIPEVALIIGRQPPVQKLGPTETANRFTMVFQNFFRIFAAKEHPFILFLDDLQWVDAASLVLLGNLLRDPEIKHLFVIGAYRVNEVGPSHRLSLMAEDIRQYGHELITVDLPPLEASHVEELIADTFSCGPEKSRPLAGLIHERTEGNPFYVNQFLQTLYDEKMLVYDPASGWQWSLEEIGRMRATDNVVDLMVGKIERLPAGTQEIVKLASCIGNTFDLETLLVVSERSKADVYFDLQKSIEHGLVVPSGDRYQFLHDRVQEAVYSLIPEGEKQQRHYAIGNLLLKQTGESDLAEKIFSIVDHLNVGAGLITGEAERYRLAELDLLAGKRAKASTAYTSAVRYLRTGTDLLSEDSWRTQNELTYALSMERYECEYLTGDFEEAERLFNAILKNAKTTLEKASVYRVKIIISQHMNKYREALEYGLEALRLLGFKATSRANKITVLLEILKVKWLLRNKTPDDLLIFPEMKDPEISMTLNILKELASVTYFISKDLFTIMMLKMLVLSIKFGNASLSSVGYGAYGMILGPVFGDYQLGYKFGEMTLKLNEKYNDPRSKCFPNFIVGTFINHWRRPLKTSLNFIVKGYNLGLDAGDFIYGGYCAGVHSATILFKGDRLNDVVEQCGKYLDVLKKIKHEEMFIGTTAVQRAAMSLAGLTKNPYTFNDADFREDQYLEMLKRDDNHFLVTLYRILKSPVLYIFEDHAGAYELSFEAQKNSDVVFAMFHSAIHNFYYSLILAALYPAAASGQKRGYWRTIKKNQKQMRIWADNCPENCLNKYLLVNAEQARIKGNYVEAEDLYDQSLKAAHENEFIHEEAIANELAGKLQLSRGRDKIAGLYMLEAHSCYEKWGATAKVKQLEEKYPQLLGKQTKDIAAPVLGAPSLDLTTVLKSSQAISGEISLDRLLRALMKIVIENAGAQKGFLILVKNDQLFIEAEGRVDREGATVLQSMPVDASKELSPAIVHYVMRTRERVVLSDAANTGIFTSDPYVLNNQPKSILCIPIIRQSDLAGILYLENNLVADAFTAERLEILNLISSQAAISLENARLYEELELRVEARTLDLSKANEILKEQINERKKAEDKLKRYSEDLAEVNEEMKNFAYIVSHDLRAPLVNIKGFSNELQYGLKEIGPLFTKYLEQLEAGQRQQHGAILQKDIPQALDFISSSVTRMDGLIESILKLSRLGRSELKPEAVRTEELVRSILKSLEHQIEVHRTQVIVDALPDIVIDRTALERIFGNLLDNALKYLEPTRQGRIEVTAERNAEEITFTVRDNGRGIAKEDAQKVFELFRRVGKQDVPGHGMGLTYVKTLVKRLGGRIWCESEPGVGTAFKFTLPHAGEKEKVH